MIESPERHVSLLDQELAWRPSAAPLLEAISEHCKVAVLSNCESNTSAEIADLVRAAGLSEGIDTVFSSRTIQIAKPDPAAFLHVVKAFDIEPAEALMIGNDPINDFQAARHAGLSAILVESDEDLVALHRLLSITRLDSDSMH